jgi:hypothetical protein
MSFLSDTASRLGDIVSCTEPERSMTNENYRILTVSVLSAATVTGQSLISFAILFEAFNTERCSLRDSHQKGRRASEQHGDRMHYSIPQFDMTLTVVWRINGSHVADLMTEQHSYNLQYFLVIL